MRLGIMRLAAAFVCVFVASAIGASAQGINARQARQQARIYRGIASGELTRQEAQRLEMQEARIAAIEARDRRSGDGLSARERHQLERDLNRESRNIYRQTHDHQHR
jgi:hypothetical protein